MLSSNASDSALAFSARSTWAWAPATSPASSNCAATAQSFWLAAISSSGFAPGSASSQPSARLARTFCETSSTCTTALARRSSTASSASSPATACSRRVAISSNRPRAATGSGSSPCFASSTPRATSAIGPWKPAFDRPRFASASIRCVVVTTFVWRVAASSRAFSCACSSASNGALHSPATSASGGRASAESRSLIASSASAVPRKVSLPIRSSAFSHTSISPSQRSRYRRSADCTLS